MSGRPDEGRPGRQRRMLIAHDRQRRRQLLRCKPGRGSVRRVHLVVIATARHHLRQACRDATGMTYVAV